MSTGSFVAVDLGATSGRVVLGRVGPGELEFREVARFPNVPVRTPDGLHWDTLGLYAGILNGLDRAFREEPGVLSIGIDSWGADYALLQDGRLLGNPFHYRDGRSMIGVESVHKRITQRQLFDRNGLQFLPLNTLYQLASESQEVLGIADMFLMTPDLIGYWLTGQPRVEITNGSTTGLMRDGGWDEELLALLQIPHHILPSPITPGEVLGPLRPELATELSGHAVVTAVGSHDTASAIVAVPMDSSSAVFISCGTWGLVGVEVANPVRTEAARKSSFTNERGVDGRVLLLRNSMGLWILSEVLREWERDGLASDLHSLLSAATDVDAPAFDADESRFFSPGSMIQRIDGWFAEHNIAAPATQAHYVRSIVESLAQSFASTALEAAAIGGVSARTIHIVGGGSLNGLLCQRTADLSGLTVVAGPDEATALGNLLIQARAGGFVTGSLDALRDLVARTHPRRYYQPVGSSQRH